MKVLVTGASGFVGYHMIDFLLNHGCEVFGTYYSNKIGDKRIKEYKCDINEYDEIKKIVKEIKPDQIYHLAGPAYIPDSFEKPKETINVVLSGTINLLEAIREYSINSQMLYVGSANEYGYFNEESLPINENASLNPLTPYAASKAGASLICYQYNKFYGINIVRARAFNHMGPKQSERFVCSGFAKQVAMIENGMKEPIISVGNIEVYRDFIDVRDVVNAYWLLLKKGKPGEVYNVSSGKMILIKDILNELIELSTYKKKIIINVDEGKIRKHDLEKVCGDNTKIIETTGWKQQFDIHDTLSNILKYWRGNL